MESLLEKREKTLEPLKIRREAVRYSSSSLSIDACILAAYCSLPAEFKMQAKSRRDCVFRKGIISIRKYSLLAFSCTFFPQAHLIR